MQKTIWVGTLVFSALATTLALGCGGDDGGGGSSGQGGSAGSALAGQGGGGGNPGFDAGTAADRNDVEPGTICARLAVVNCAGEQACCDDPGRDFEACREDVEETCAGSFLLDMTAGAAEVAFSASAASAAFAELEQRAAACDPSVAAWAVSPQGFAASFVGTLGTGEDCEPEGGLDAAIPDLLAALASCRIGMGLACLPADAGWACAARAPAGGRCFTDLNCVDGLYCDNPSGEFDGSCVDRKAAAAACDGATECDSFVCKSGMCTAVGDVQAAYCLK